MRKLSAVFVVTLGLALWGLAGCGGDNTKNGNNNNGNGGMNTNQDAYNGNDTNQGGGGNNNGGGGFILDNGTPGDPGNGGGNGGGTGNGCQSCAANSCSSEVGACQQDAECSALLQCLQGCGQGDNNCQKGCMSQHQNGYGKMDLMQMCLYKNCKSDCGFPASPCYDCITTSCYDAVAKCDNNNECVAILICAQTKCAPTDKSCIQGCMTQHQGGLADLQGMIQCIQGSCGNACKQQ